MAITDAVVARPDIDADRTAAMGGSYGGYMANWIAGHTDRFRCIVTHASLWALDQFQGTTDAPGYWAKEWGIPTERPERYAQWSPHHFAGDIRTPMLVVHGDKDYRVPIGEGLRLWWDLQRAGVESAFLLYPDEGHWILKPGNARVWYETVWAWLAKYVHDAEWVAPELL
jgi:dipeptidyl aminopeptidase/acylaminoacyl peptidase